MAPDSPSPDPAPMPLFGPDDLSDLSPEELPIHWEEEETEFLVVPAEEPEPMDDLPTVVLPMQLVGLEALGFTHVGRQRLHNEDFFDLQTLTKASETPIGKTLQAQGLYILCDGMGGHSGGEIASAMAVEQLKNYFKVHWQDRLPDEEVIRNAIYVANQALFEVNERNASSGNERMGTTVVLALLQGNQVAIAHVGDSRCYRYTRRLGLEQLTVDHEVGQLEIRRGVDPEVAYAHPAAYQLTQALGPKGSDYIQPEVQYLELQEDTLLLLCSDGLSDYGLLEDHPESVEALLSSRTVLEQGMGDLMDLANACNGHDNITAIAIRAKVRPNLQPIKS